MLVLSLRRSVKPRANYKLHHLHLISLSAAGSELAGPKSGLVSKCLQELRGSTYPWSPALFRFRMRSRRKIVKGPPARRNFRFHIFPSHFRRMRRWPVLCDRFGCTPKTRKPRSEVLDPAALNKSHVWLQPVTKRFSPVFNVINRRILFSARQYIEKTDSEVSRPVKRVEGP